MIKTTVKTKKKSEKTESATICPNCGQGAMMPDGAKKRNMFWCPECGLTTTDEALHSMALAQ